MSCYHPLFGVPEYRSESGKWVFVPRGNYDPDMARTWHWSPKEDKKGDRPKPILMPCGKCIGCRLDYSRSWADRMMLELDYHRGKAIFATLTYDNDHVPITSSAETGEAGFFSLYKPDLQKFLKRLRKRFSDKEIRFYACGEYGSNTFRPHYHVIIFGLDLNDFPDKVAKGRNELKQVYFISDEFYKIWKNGFILLTAVSWQTFAYVSRYVQKKVYACSNPYLDQYGCEKEFSLMSRRPGLGGHYMDDHPNVFEYTNIYVSGYERPISIPKYFLKRLELIDPELCAKLKEERKQFVDDRLLLKMQQTDLSYIQQLEIEENEKLTKVKALRRL